MVSFNDHTPVPVAFDRLLTDSGLEALVLHAPSGLMHFTSPSAGRLLNCDSPTGTNLLDHLDASEREDVGNAFRDAVIRRQPIMARTVRVGSRHIVLMTLPVMDHKGGVVELQTTLRDVSEFVALRERIRTHESVTAVACEMARVGGWYFDADSDELYWSDEVRRIHEVPKNFVPTVNSAIQFYAQDQRHVIEDAVRAGLDEGRSTTIELPLVTHAGRHIWVRASLMADTPGRPSRRIYGAFQDITDLHERERQLQDTVQTMSRKSDQLEEFAYVISHHLRGPVANIISLLEPVDTASMDDDLRATLEHLDDAARQLLDTFEDLTHVIAARHQEVPNLELLRVSDVVQGVTDELHHQLEQTGARVSVETDEHPTLLYPRAHLETIVRQLIANAIRFAAPGRPPRIRIRTEQQDERAVLIVSDNGLGIDLDKYGSKIFRLRSTAHRGTASRGVGLYLVRSIVESMGGSITVSSRVDEGSTFTVDCSVRTSPSAER